jgi:transposase
MSNDLPQTIGIDISKAALDCHAHPAGIDRQFPNTAKGHKALIAWAGQWQVERIAYEATGTYHRALEVALGASALRQAQRGTRKALRPGDGHACQTDRIDARLLARMAVALQPPVRPARSPQQNQLAELVNARDGLVRDRTALKNRQKNLTVTLLKRQCSQRLE